MQHPNARLSVYQRNLIAERVEGGWTVTRAARAAGVSRQTASKWVNRFRRFGPDALKDSSSRPRHTRPRVGAGVVKRIIRARLRFRRGPHFLGWRRGIAGSTVYVVLRRLGLNRLRAGLLGGTAPALAKSKAKPRFHTFNVDSRGGVLLLDRPAPRCRCSAFSEPGLLQFSGVLRLEETLASQTTLISGPDRPVNRSSEPSAKGEESVIAGKGAGDALLASAK